MKQQAGKGTITMEPTVVQTEEEPFTVFDWVACVEVSMTAPAPACRECNWPAGHHSRDCSRRVYSPSARAEWERFTNAGARVVVEKPELWPLVLRFVETAATSRSAVELLAAVSSNEPLSVEELLDQWVAVEPDAGRVSPGRIATLERTDLLTIAHYTRALAQAHASDEAEYPTRPPIVEQLLAELTPPTAA